MMRLRLLPLLLLALACSSSSPSPEGGDSAPAGLRPSITMQIRGSVHMDRTGEGPMTLLVHITNRAADAITLRRVRVQSWAMEQWAIDPAERYIVEKLAPGESKTVEISATAYRKSQA